MMIMSSCPVYSQQDETDGGYADWMPASDGSYTRTKISPELLEAILHMAGVKLYVKSCMTPGAVIALN